MAIRIVIADDHRILRAGLITLLSADPNLQVVGEATNGDEALATARKLRPDIIMMDIGMPGNETLEATRQVIASVPETRVLMLTMHEDTSLLQECLRAGVYGYIIKRAAESELMDAIYAIHRGIIYIHPSLMPSLVAGPQKTTPAGSSHVETLTAREIDVLKMIVQGHTNRQIAEELNLSVRTVETHRSNIMDKLNLHSRVDLVRYAYKHKLVKNDID